MVSPILRAEQLDIDAEKNAILANLRTGDFNKQMIACEQLDTLAESHFQAFLLQTVTLRSDANRLDDRIRERRISAEEQSVEIRQLIATAVSLLTEMTKTAPVSNIALDQLPPTDRAEKEIRAAQIANDLGRKLGLEEQDQKNNDEEEEELINFIVQTREPRSQGKLIVAQDITKGYAGSTFRLRPISFELTRGEILGIVGVNASGKTTLLRILLGDLRQSAGELDYPSFNQNGKGRDWIGIKRRIGYVSQTLPRRPGKVYDKLKNPTTVRVGDPVSIIQHPLGGPKQVALSANEVINVYERRIQYITDTMPGSSGAPVFNTMWDVVAVHHAGGNLLKSAAGDRVFANEGVSIESILAVPEVRDLVGM
jgi:ABC transporter/Trypsin-like peptidase domain